MNDKKIHEALQQRLKECFPLNEKAKSVKQLEFERGFIEGAKFVDSYYKTISCGVIPYDSLSESFKKIIENIK